MVLGASEVAGLALTSVGVAQLPIVAVSQATWERFMLDYHQKFLPLHARLNILIMHIQVLKRRPPVTFSLPMDFPESIMTEKLDNATDVITKAMSMCEEYNKLAPNGRNAWGRYKGDELKSLIESGEEEMNLVLQYFTVRSQDMLIEVRDRLQQSFEEETQQCGSGEVEDNIHSDASAVGDEPLAEINHPVGLSGKGVMGAITWVLLIAMSVTILVKVGHKM